MILAGEALACWLAILLAQPFGCRVRFPRFALGFMGVAACETDGILDNPAGTCGGQEAPCLNQAVDDRRGGTAKRVHMYACSLPLVVKTIPPCRTSFRLGR